MIMEMINGNRHLEKKYPMIHGIGCIIPKKNMSAPQVTEILQRDLILARSISYRDGNEYFRRKTVMIEEALKEFLKTKNGHAYPVGYEPGFRYIYPGLPIEFAMHIDTAIRETIEMISRCGAVSFVGFNCAGHPSGLLENPVYEEYLENPSRILAQYGIAYMNESIYGENRNPYLTLLLKKEGNGEMIKQELLKIDIEGAYENAKVRIRAREGFFEQHSPNDNLMFVSIAGLPGLFINGSACEFNDFVAAYKKALQRFWFNVQKVFERSGGDFVPEPDGSQFVPRSVGFDKEWDLVMKRSSNGHKLANYYYFNGEGKLIVPEFIGNGAIMPLHARTANL